ncbi:hypothetical protein U1Q18_026338 [Sarracenia purpurea var. burkii]
MVPGEVLSALACKCCYFAPVWVSKMKRVAARVLVDVIPYKEIERDVEQFPAGIGIATAGGGVRDPDARLVAKVRAPGGVVLEELAAEMADDGDVRRVDVLRTRGEAHL